MISILDVNSVQMAWFRRKLVKWRQRIWLSQILASYRN